jgi:siroheme synthase
MAEKKTEPAAQEPDGDALAVAIRKISESVAKMTRSGMNRDAIVALIHDDTKVAKRTIVVVLDSLESLARKYTRTRG